LFLFVAALTVLNNLGLAWAFAGAGRRLTLDVLQTLLLVAVLLWAVKVEGQSLAQLGFRLGNVKRDLAWGVAAGVGMAILACVFFALPLVASPPVRYSGYATLDIGGALAVVGGRLLLTHALLEETLFRGLIQPRAVGWLGLAHGSAVTSAIFVIWHPVLTWVAIVQTTLAAGQVPVVVWFVLATIPLACAGVIFGVLRHANGSLLCPVIAHWVVNSVILGFLALAGQP
jgi:membrane protease YdiL (CAAX protease family)